MEGYFLYIEDTLYQRGLSLNMEGIVKQRGLNLQGPLYRVSHGSGHNTSSTILEQILNTGMYIQTDAIDAHAYIGQVLGTSLQHLNQIG